MNLYTTSALIAFALFGMGLTAVILGTINFRENTESKAGLQMFLVCLCVFGWDFGYAWMSLCYDDDFAYVARAIALLSVTLYMFFTLSYAGNVANYSRKKLYTFLTICCIVSLAAWTQIIQKSAVEFVITPWGYWYKSEMSVARLVQFASVIAALVQYYIMVMSGRKKATTAREKYVLNGFMWFGPILFTGYLFDTLIPTLFDTAAIPGSSISAFVSALILFRVSQVNKVFGLSKVNVSEYVFEDVHIPVIITDNNGQIVLYNNIAPQYLELNEGSLKNKSMESFFDEDDDSVRVVGTDKECKLDKTEVKDKFDSLLYTIYFVNDITQERQTLRMLEESRAIAEEANRAKSNFLANMSHEIRTPMNAIIGMSQIIMQDDTVSEKVMSQVDEIHTAGQNLLDIINDILDLSKIEAGKYELITDEYDFPALIHDVCSVIRVRMQESNAVFILKLDDTLPSALVGDVVRIRQILFNILGNAVKFIKKGSVTFTVNWNKNEASPEIYFDVADTGIGISKENLDKIFGEFTQVDTKKNREVQGTGLGLAISKHLAELMDGTITVDSVYGEGSTFHITIRQGVKQYKAIGETISKALEQGEYKNIMNAQPEEIVQRPDAKILIVDDTKVNLKIAAGVMKKYGMQIDTATSGMEAIEKVQQTDYDLVFMDHMMPVMDGVETTKKIRELGGKYEDLVIIALTANAISGAKEMFISEGLQDFVTKPIEPKILNEVLNRWLPV